ncbi:SAM-dependent methyltransferase, partial [Amycolatopsis vastitatis]
MNAPLAKTGLLRTPVGVNSGRPTPARLYNAALHGTDNYQVDRILLDKLTAAVPAFGFALRSEAEFVCRAVRYIAAAHDITQWVTAVPWSLPQPSVDRIDEVICGPDGDARVWYLEYEPVVLAHLRALVGNDGGDRPVREGPVRIVDADPLNPAAVQAGLASHRTPPEDGPIGVVLGGTLSFHPGTRDDAAAVVQEHIAWLPPGSVLVLTHLLDPEEPALTQAASRVQALLLEMAGAVATRAEIRTMV